jgi:ABC-type multidrug transport system permease subunit
MITLHITKRYLSVSFFDQIWRQLLSSLAMLTVLLYFQRMWSHSILSFLMGIAVGGLIYLAVLAILGYERVVEEIRSLWRQ